MSYQSSSPYIKPDPDAPFYGSPSRGPNFGQVPMQQSLSSSSGGNMMGSRNILGRGFSSFDDNSTNVVSSMIPEADLLDLDLGGDISGNGSFITSRGQSTMDSALDAQPGPGNISDQQQANSYGAPSSMNMGGYFSPSSRPINMAPPIASSTSPFDDFIQQQHQSVDQKLNGSTSSSVPAIPSLPVRYRASNDYAPKQQSNLQSMSIPDSVGSWGTPDDSLDLTLSPPSLNYRADTSEKQQLLMLEKRRRRRESHNAVERRRRDNINEKIQELALLIPENLLAGTGIGNGGGVGTVSSGSLGADIEASTPSGLSGVSAASAAAAGKDGKPNKGIILRKSVDYIRHLQQSLEFQRRKNEELAARLQRLEEQYGITPTRNSGVDQQSEGVFKGLRFDDSPREPEEQNDFAVLDYDEQIFPTSPQDREYSGMDMS
ncbi:helix-loop-helix DNA-binding domain-containing protein [Lipomyces oligophaga]|uniref:helix-loop-helix DNA-binding domain-containing protein n=1 Tax=Lipomyces oligophaga TaxID=45792 RepID=UPI0034CFAF49